MFFTLILSSLLTFVELNCENLFDTVHDSLKNDMEYTPESEYHWTNTRYWKKLNDIAKEIIALGGDENQPSLASSQWQLPDFVAMCEVENDSVMVALTKRSLLRHARYEYLMTQSPDERGIDVALMYSPASFRPIRSYSIRIKQLPGTRPTRDILYASGLLVSDDTLHIFVVHAPSRRGGEVASRPYRLQVANQLASAVDSIYAINAHAHVMVTGDFNDYSDSPALDSLYRHRLVNISADAMGRNGAKGTYRYHGEWRSLDQMLCSPALAACKEDCKIGDLRFLLEEDEKYGGMKPFRTYIGPKYKGGYSDHLPLVARFRIKE